MSARVKLPDPLDKLLRSELEKAIYEAALDRDDDLIARRYIVEKKPQIDIAAELGWDRSTVLIYVFFFDDLHTQVLLSPWSSSYHKML